MGGCAERAAAGSALGLHSVARAWLMRTRACRPGGSTSTLEAIMFEQRLLAGLAAALIWLPIIANAQSGSAPGSRERELAQIIREAGYECSQVESITNAAAPPPGWESLRPEIATCRNGKRFLVTKSGRSGGNLRPVVRPMPSQSGVQDHVAEGFAEVAPRLETSIGTALLDERLSSCSEATTLPFGTPT